jgi:hypothetical protein
MTKTVSELADDIWRIRLGLVDINKSPTAAQRAMVEALYEQKFAELSIQDKTYWPASEIPELVFGALSRILAEEICIGRRLPIPTEPDDDGQPLTIGAKGWRLFHRVIARERTGLPTQASYF